MSFRTDLNMDIAKKATPQHSLVVIPKEGGNSLAKNLYSKQTGCERSREEMVKAYLPAVRMLAKKIHRRLPPGIDLESLVNSGVVGLLEALDSFDSERGADFEGYAQYRIRGEITQCLRSLDWASRSVRSWGRKMEAARSRLEGKFVREPTPEEVATELGLSLKKYHQIHQQVSEVALLSIEDLSTFSEPEWEKAQEKIGLTCSGDPLKSVLSKDLMETLTSAISKLPERERLIVKLYIYEELTLKEIGELLNLSESRVCQIYAQAFDRLRNFFGINASKQRVEKSLTRVRENKMRDRVIA